MLGFDSGSGGKALFDRQLFCLDVLRFDGLYRTRPHSCFSVFRQRSKALLPGNGECGFSSARRMVGNVAAQSRSARAAINNLPSSSVFGCGTWLNDAPSPSPRKIILLSSRYGTVAHNIRGKLPWTRRAFACGHLLLRNERCSCGKPRTLGHFESLWPRFFLGKSVSRRL